MKKFNFLMLLCLAVFTLNMSAQTIAAGVNKTLIYDNNSLYQMGGNSNATNPLQQLTLPVNSSGIKVADASSSAEFVLFNDGNLYCKGLNYNGILGKGYANVNGPISSHSTFEKPISPFHSGLLDAVMDISVGYGNVLILLNSGEVLQMGNISDQSYHAAPTFVTSYGATGNTISNITKVAAGYEANYAIDISGDVWVWGDNSHGLLGDPGLCNTQNAFKMLGLSNVIDIQTSGRHTLFLHANGEVSGLGNNSFGELGIGNNTSIVPFPIKVKASNNSYLTDVIDIAVSQSNSYFLFQNGTVKSTGLQNWGSLGQTGVASPNFITIPEFVVNETNTGNLTNVIDIDGGYGAFVVAKKSNCEAVAWGNSLYMPFGIQNTPSQPIPVNFDISFLGTCSISYTADEYTICPETCTTVEAIVGAGLSNATINWSFPGADITTGSGLSEEVCYSTPGTHDVFASVNGGPSQNTGITITVRPFNHPKCRSFNNRVSLYPNPSADSFSIDGIDKKNINSISINNLNDRELKSYNINDTDFSIKSLNTGMYIVVIKTKDGEIITKKIVKE